ncbi:hypothetical protein [Cyclobacterium qasimii]|nr:hypothetical protein [Cyclobacterium qasimii]GEO23209.1 hypothetical protein CQA01_37430 [Cyclobacterium qasimii]
MHGDFPDRIVLHPTVNPLETLAGLKRYDAQKFPWRERKASNTHMRQLIEITGDKHEFKAYTMTGELSDAFDLKKDKSGSNKLINPIPDLPEN